MSRARFALAVALAAVPAVAAAGPRKILVLRADGAIDAATRERIDTAVLDLARHLDGEITQGDIAYTDAAAAVGCSDTVAACSSMLVDGLGSDEVIVVQTAPMPGGDVMVTVTRATPAGATEATSTVAAAAPEQPLADGIGPLFGMRAAPAPVLEPSPPAAAVIDPFVAPAPAPGPIDTPRRRSNTFAYATLGAGSAFAVLGIVMWAKTAGLANEISDAPTQTRADFAHLEDLESSADTYSTLGNITFAAGVALAGVGAYLWWRNRPGDAPAVVAPFALDHGAGIAVSFGARR